MSLISSTSHSATNHPTSPSSYPFPCSVSPAGSVLDGLGFAHSQESRQLASAESCSLALRTGCLALGCSRPRLAASPLLCASCSFTVLQCRPFTCANKRLHGALGRASRPSFLFHQIRAGRPCQCAAEEHITAGESPALFNRERTRSTKKGRRCEAGSEATECEITSLQRK